MQRPFRLRKAYGATGRLGRAPPICRLLPITFHFSPFTLLPHPARAEPQITALSGATEGRGRIILQTEGESVRQCIAELHREMSRKLLCADARFIERASGFIAAAVG